MKVMYLDKFLLKNDSFVQFSLNANRLMACG